MSKHTSYRGLTIDMDSMRRENESATALGNMSVNAKGDKLGKGGVVTQTAAQAARVEQGRKTVVVQAGLKGPVPASPVAIETPKVATPVKANVSKVKETELPNGDITVEEDKDAS